MNYTSLCNNCVNNLNVNYDFQFLINFTALLSVPLPVLEKWKIKKTAAKENEKRNKYPYHREWNWFLYWLIIFPCQNFLPVPNLKENLLTTPCHHGPTDSPNKWNELWFDYDG